jgi:hypothetical protein
VELFAFTVSAGAAQNSAATAIATLVSQYFPAANGDTAATLT